MRAIYEVQTVSRGDGKENWVKVRATSREDAANRVAALGEIVGKARMLEVVDDAATEASPIQVALAPAIPGQVTCPTCSRHSWESGRGLAVWLGILLFFPLGLLLLLVQPTHKCLHCGYSFTSYRAPAVDPSDLPPRGVWYYLGQVTLWLILVAILVGVVAFVRVQL